MGGTQADNLERDTPEPHPPRRAGRSWTQWPLMVADIQIYDACDAFSGALICLMLVFSPWAFGTTQPWSIWTMNILGYLLGGLLLTKLAIRRFKSYRPPRWDLSPLAPDFSRAFGLTRELAVLTAAILGFCLLSALNARSAYSPQELSFQYYSSIPWLPGSLDANATWAAFWNYLGLASSFWAIRDWLLGRSETEARTEWLQAGDSGSGSKRRLSDRLRLLLWVLTINGGLLGLEGIIQRLEGSGLLLFLVRPRVNPGAETQFGPYAYHANAAAYFNLLWPVCLGFWWTLQRGSRRPVQVVALVCIGIMAACPTISTSRGGALVSLGLAVLTLLCLVGVQMTDRPRHSGEGRQRNRTTTLIVGCLIGGLVLGLSLGWNALAPRLEQLNGGYDLREKMYDAARPMADDYPLYGTGPGTFATVFQLYRATIEDYPPQLHNDWLETLITFGWVGSALIALALVTVLLRWFVPGGLYGGKRLVFLSWLALAGCLVHARWDFPFLIYSILFLFLTWCAILTVMSRRP